jgi:hypothetical protein
MKNYWYYLFPLNPYNTKTQIDFWSVTALTFPNPQLLKAISSEGFDNGFSAIENKYPILMYSQDYNYSSSDNGLFGVMNGFTIYSIAWNYGTTAYNYTSLGNPMNYYAPINQWYLNATNNEFIDRVPMALNYSLGQIIGNPFLNLSGIGASGLPSAILPKNYINGFGGNTSNGFISVNATLFTYQFPQAIVFTQNVLLFNSLQIPTYFYQLFGLFIIMILILFYRYEGANIFVIIGMIGLWIIGLINMSFIALSLFITLIFLAYEFIKLG